MRFENDKVTATSAMLSIETPRPMVNMKEKKYSKDVTALSGANYDAAFVHVGC